MTAFVGHPCRDDEGKYLVGILLYLRLSETRVKIEGLTLTVTHEHIFHNAQIYKYKYFIVNHDAQY